LTLPGADRPGEDRHRCRQLAVPAKRAVTRITLRGGTVRIRPSANLSRVGMIDRPKSRLYPAHPVPLEGVSRSSRTLDRMRWTRMSKDNDIARGRRSRVVLSPTLASSLEKQAFGATVAIKPVTGRARIAVKPLRREGRCSGEPVVTNSRVFYTPREAAVQRAPAFLRPLISRRRICRTRCSWAADQNAC